MNGEVGVKKAALNKVKQVANAATNAAVANGNGNNKKRRKDLKPIIIGEKQQGGPTQSSVGSAMR
jgi:serine/threonine-protein kinase SRPK3